MDGAFTKHLSGASLGAKAQANWSCSLITLQGRARALIEALIAIQRVTASCMKTSRYGTLPPCKRTHKEALQQGHSVEVNYKKVSLSHEALPLPKRVESISENPSIVKNQHHQRLYFVQLCPTSSHLRHFKTRAYLTDEAPNLLGQQSRW